MEVATSVAILAAGLLAEWLTHGAVLLYRALASRERPERALWAGLAWLAIYGPLAVAVLLATGQATFNPR